MFDLSANAQTEECSQKSRVNKNKINKTKTLAARHISFYDKNFKIHISLSNKVSSNSVHSKRTEGRENSTPLRQ